MHYWNKCLISREEIISIQSIPVSATDEEDAFIWRGTAKGDFPVRSAYHVQKDRETENKAEGSSRVRNNTIWRNIWQYFNIPNVEKHFLWRACHDILPTRVSRKVLMDPSCPICEREPETVWQCPSASDVWSAGCTKF